MQAPAAPAAESQLTVKFLREDLEPTRWSNGPHAVYGVHDHPYGKVLMVVSGQITFALSETGREISMGPGERLDLPPRTPHSAVVGPNGVVCLEAHVPSRNPST